MWRLALGMVLSLLPGRWRRGYGLQQAIPWERAAILSGVLETLVALGFEVVWYSNSVTTWAADALDSALRNGPQASIPAPLFGLTALGIWAFHPLTWLIGYFVAEGAVRMLAAVATEQIYGTAPLALAAWIYGKARGRAPEGDALQTPGAKEHLRSMVAAVKEQITITRMPEVEDEVREFSEGADEILEIHASRRKAEWNPPRVVRIGDRYFRLEEEVQTGSAPRPFVFRLRRLPAGVPGRTVIVYEPPV